VEAPTDASGTGRRPRGATDPMAAGLGGPVVAPPPPGPHGEETFIMEEPNTSLPFILPLTYI